MILYHYDALHKLRISLGLLQPHQYKQLINTPYQDNMVHTCTLKLAGTLQCDVNIIILQ